MNNNADKIRELIDKLNYYTKCYDEGRPEITDEEWDDMYFELVKLEKDYNIYCDDSPTQKINYQVVNELKKVEHNHPMLSLDKTKEMGEVYGFLKNQHFLSMCKMDGLTCSLRYLNGELVSAETRGDGVVGEDILHNAKVVKNIPNKINYKDELIVDGEIICTYQDFEPFSEEYVHPRNFASGSIRLLDSEECRKRNLTFVVWDVIKGFEEETHLSDKLFRAGELGFTIVPHLPGDDWDAKEYLCERAKEEGYPIDGLVFKFNNIALGKAQGATEHHLKNAIAFKFYDEETTSYLKDIEWSMGRTGVLTPVAIFKPVDIDFTRIERASLHNLSVMAKVLGDMPYIDEEIHIIKANQIIPQITSAVYAPGPKAKFLNIPKFCPICGKDLDIVKTDNAELLVCQNDDCQGKILNKLDHFAGKNGLDIKQLSIETLKKMMDWGYINTFADIYELERYKDALAKKSGWSKRSADRILYFIDQSKITTSDKFISAIGIPLIGKGVAKQLVRAFGNYLDFRDAVENNFDFSTLEGFGPEKVEAIMNFDYHEADEVAKYLWFVDKADKKTDASLNGKTFVITGTLENYSRNDLIALIEEKGGKVAGSVSKNTTALINNNINSTSSKNMRAKELNIPIITENDFVNQYIS